LSIFALSYLEIIGKNSLIQSVGKGASLFLGLLSVGILTRYLGEGGYGKYVIAFSYFSIFTIFADFGLQVVMVRELIERESKVLGTYLSIKVILAVFSIFIAVVVLLFFPYGRALKVTIFIGILATSVGFFNSFGFVFLQSRLKILLSTGIDLSIKILVFALIVFFVKNDLGLNWVVSATLVGNVVNGILFLVLVKKTSSFELSFKKDVAIGLLQGSLPVALAIFFASLFFKVDTLILSVFRTNQEVGSYGLSCKIIENLLVFWGFFMVTAYPLMAELYKKKRVVFEDFWIKILVVSQIFSLMLVVSIFFLAPLINFVLAGSNFSDSTLLIRILAFSLPFFIANNLFFHKFIIKNKSGYILLIVSITLFVHILMNLIFVPKSGYLASSFSIIFTQFLMTCLYFIFNICFLEKK